MAKRIYRTLELDGYARIDFRLSADGTPYFLEANPNPEIAESEEFALSAKHDGIKYPDLLHRIVALAIKRRGPGPIVCSTIEGFLPARLAGKACGTRAAVFVRARTLNQPEIGTIPRCLRYSPERQILVAFATNWSADNGHR